MNWKIGGPENQANELVRPQKLKTLIFAASAAAAAAAKIEKQITSGRPPVKKKLAPDGRTDEKKKEKIKVRLKR